MWTAIRNHPNDLRLDISYFCYEQFFIVNTEGNHGRCHLSELDSYIQGEGGWMEDLEEYFVSED